MDTCYWCGEKVKDGEGSKEHLVPRALLSDVPKYKGEFTIPAKNAHTICNNRIGNTHEHNFCQIIFNYTVDEPRARKHVESKTRNLNRQPDYAKKEFSKMTLNGNRTEVQITENERTSFNECVKKIIKGLFFKEFGRYLDFSNEYFPRIIWTSFNLRYDPYAQKIVKTFCTLLNEVPLQGNEVFKFRHKAVESGMSSLWEIVFYDKLPAYVILVHSSEKEQLKAILEWERTSL